MFGRAPAAYHLARAVSTRAADIGAVEEKQWQTPYNN
jgi:hypothetical protein